MRIFTHWWSAARRAAGIERERLKNGDRMMEIDEVSPNDCQLSPRHRPWWTNHTAYDSGMNTHKYTHLSPAMLSMISTLTDVKKMVIICLSHSLLSFRVYTWTISSRIQLMTTTHGGKRQLNMTCLITSKSLLDLVFSTRRST